MNPTKPQNPLILSHFFNTFACEYQNSYGINLRLHPVPLLDLDVFYPFYPTCAEFAPLFAIQQIDKLLFCRAMLFYPVLLGFLVRKRSA